jgi:RNA polymerase sigma factor (TIGR02999 family)
MEVTQALKKLQSDEGKALEALIPLVYQELKKLARARLRREGEGGALQTTALVHEAFLRLAGARHPVYENRAHFYGIASRLMRQILVDAARSRSSKKRGAGGEIAMATLPEWVGEPNRSALALNDALERMEKVHPRMARLIEMRYFGGLNASESAEAISLPVHVVRRDLRLAHAWLRQELAAESEASARDRKDSSDTAASEPSRDGVEG